MAGNRFKARKTIYKGIEMRSRLEAGFAQWLDQEIMDWSHEPFAVASESGQYLPDFLVRNLYYVAWGRVVPTFVEVKPDSFSLASSEGNRLLRSLSLVAESAPGSFLVVVQPKTVTQVFAGCGEGCVEEHGPYGHSEPRWGGQLRWVAIAIPTSPVGLARLLPDAALPWAGEYWKVEAE
jgi:hypothetical protein